MNPLVTVIIPTYNHRDFVLQTLDSVFAQSMTDLEVILINDGSPDDTADVVRLLVEAGRVRYFEHPNAGQAAARNQGLKEAAGEYVAFLDDDDVWPPDHLEWQVATLEALPAHVGVAGAYVTFGEPGPAPAQAETPIDARPADFIEEALMRSPGQVLFRKSALLASGGFDLAIRGADDWDLYLRISRLGPIRIDPRLALRYRVHAGNASRNYWLMYRNSLRVYRKHCRVDPHYNWLRWLWGSPALARMYRFQADQRMRESSGIGKLLHRARSRWCSMILLPGDVFAWVKITGGRVRRGLLGPRRG